MIHRNRGGYQFHSVIVPRRLFKNLGMQNRNPDEDCNNDYLSPVAEYKLMPGRSPLGQRGKQGGPFRGRRHNSVCSFELLNTEHTPKVAPVLKSRAPGRTGLTEKVYSPLLAHARQRPSLPTFVV